jgi:phospholipase C
MRAAYLLQKSISIGMILTDYLKYIFRSAKMNRGRLAHASVAFLTVAMLPQVTISRAIAADAALTIPTTTPVKHLIIISGENRGFDNVFATYVPPTPRQRAWNLLSKGIVTKAGAPGVNAYLAQQKLATDRDVFRIAPEQTGSPWRYLPQPSTTLNALPTSPCTLSTLAKNIDHNVVGNFCVDPGLGAPNAPAQAQLQLGGTGLSFYFSLSLAQASTESLKVAGQATGSPLLLPEADCRYPTNLPNAPYSLVGASQVQDGCVSPKEFEKLKIAKTITPTKFSDQTGDPVHRFFQMWQQNDCSASAITSDNPSGCRHDLYTWVATTVGWQITADGNPPTNDQGTFQGGVAMGYYNMAAGDYPYFNALAQRYTISDNYHQPIMGGTGANSQFMMTGDVYFYTDANGAAATPPSFLIENPNPISNSNNFYTFAKPGSQTGKDMGNTSTGGLVNCSDNTQPGVASIRTYLGSLPYKPFRDGNCEPGHYYQVDNEYPYYTHTGSVISSSDTNEFSAGPDYAIGPQTLPTIGDALAAKNISWRYYGEGFSLAANPLLEDEYYCAICNGFQYSKSIMTTGLKSNLVDLPNFFSDITAGTLPAVSYVKPNILLDSHPGTSTPPLFEAFVKNIVTSVQANSALWGSTAILITFDESGGYYDSGYIQPIDFFGDGPRTVLIAVSPFSKQGVVDHTYGDHASILKFIERNWKLTPLSARSRDNLPNPVTQTNPYIPVNAPAIGDLMGMFTFTPQ